MPVSRPKLLLADDSVTIQKVVNLTFADQGMDVVTFSDGDSAIENLDDVKPAVVLADVHMPGINGYQLCELMRSDSSNKDIPVLLLVGSFEPFDRDEAERVGASGYMTKPFASIAELVTTVQGLLASSAPAPAEETPVPGDHDGAQQRVPDTADIDTLYEKSLAETVEIPQDELESGYPASVIDDEMMIATSYSEGNGGDDEFLTIEHGSEHLEDADGDIDHETEALVFESMPAEEHEAEAEHGFSAAAGAWDETPAPVSADSSSPDNGLSHEEPVRDEVFDDAGEIGGAFDVRASDDERADAGTTRSDPFVSFAGEPVPTAGADDNSERGETRQYSLDDLDLLELPGSSRPGSGVPDSAAPVGGKPVTDISPELIDLIVEKVIERLQGKG